MQIAIRLFRPNSVPSRLTNGESITLPIHCHRHAGFRAQAHEVVERELVHLVARDLIFLDGFAWPGRAGH